MSFRLILLLFVLAFSLPTFGQNSVNYKLHTIVIDPGHGGSQPGAIYGSYKEKDITLKVGLAVGKKIEEAFPLIKVIYTRKTDIDVPLHTRSQIANDAGADLFISIHVNSAGATSARGTETFLMGYDKSQQNLQVAMKENEVVTMEAGYEQKYEGFDPNSAESYIIFSLMQYSYLEQSTLIASYIQDEYNKSSSLPNRGVKQAPFLVLWQTSTPSILTEIGFLSNSTDRAFLTSASGQEKIASSVFRGFCRYKSTVEGVGVFKDSGDIKQGVSTGSNSTRPTVKPASVSKYEPQASSEKGDVFYSVQISSSLTRQRIDSSNFGSYFNQVRSYYIDGRYKYFVGMVKSNKEALSLQSKLREYRFRDAFMVAFKDNKVISVSEANRLLGVK